MSDLESQETRLSFDDILEAVQDSKRGRWFLQEFETRLQKRDTQSLLSAMNRLEARMEQLGPQSAKPDGLASVTAAIATARNDLLKLGLGREAMSKEGRLFADLAEQARKNLPPSNDVAPGVVRALQLVDEIETVAFPGGHGKQFFQPDAAVFEPAPPAAKPVLVAAVPEAKAPPTGARLVIRKADAATVEPEEFKAQESVPQPAAPVEPREPQMMDNPRIVIIRRKPEDMPDVGVEDSVSAA